MSRLQDLCVRVLTRCGVNPMAGDLTGEVAPWPVSAPVAPFRSPYECEPSRWGEEDVPTPGPVSTARRGSSSAGRGTGWKARRLKLEVDREPAPRGLLVS